MPVSNPSISRELAARPTSHLVLTKKGVQNSYIRPQNHRLNDDANVAFNPAFTVNSGPGLEWKIYTPFPVEFSFKDLILRLRNSEN